MKRIFTYTISPEDDGCILRDFLSQKGFSRHILVGMKAYSDSLLLNGERPFLNRVLQTGDTLAVTLRDEVSSEKIPPVELPLSILYEDEDIVVFNKPSGMPVHESRNHLGDTLSNFAAYHIGENTAFRAVYRLDRDTSGAVLVAKNELAASKLAGKIKKDYYAIVGGKIEGDGVIDAPIARCSDSIIKRRVYEGGEKAVTQYSVISSNENASLVKCNLLTGRTHQIRVHFEYLGHPLLGDDLYGGECEHISRQALHCRDIYFTHPITQENMHIFCDFSDDIKEVIRCLHL